MSDSRGKTSVKINDTEWEGLGNKCGQCVQQEVAVPFVPPKEC